ncbi:MAG: mechanosensitive ion channel family protein [Janthinobacterium lividum]
MNHFFSNGLDEIAVLAERFPLLSLLIGIVLAWVLALILHRLTLPILRRLSKPFAYSRRLIEYGHRAGRAVVFFLLVQFLLRATPDEVHHLLVLRDMSAIGMIGALTWLLVRAIKAIADSIVETNPLDTRDNLHARRIHTQTKVLSRTVMGVVILLGTGTALMTLPLLRQIGASVLASAGVAGLVVGFAAKPVLGNLLAGLQLALAQPIRLADVVIVEGEWGEIEEITGTYVVIRIWDQRRLIVPLQWFIEHPFQNWTRQTSELLGSVMIWADYRLPLEPLRAEARRLCEAAPEWDGRVAIVQVVETSEQAMQLRVLVSSRDAPGGWDLRCKVREGLLVFIQRDYPDCLPRLRNEVRFPAGQGAGSDTALD